MLTILTETKGNLLALRVTDKFTSEDFEQYKIMISDLRQRFRNARLYFEMAGFKGWEIGRLIRNALFDIVNGRQYGKVAMVAEKWWQHLAARLASPVKKEGIKYFSLVEKEKAKSYVDQ